MVGRRDEMEVDGREVQAGDGEVLEMMVMVNER